MEEKNTKYSGVVRLLLKDFQVNSFFLFFSFGRSLKIAGKDMKYHWYLNNFSYFNFKIFCFQEINKTKINKTLT